LENWERGTYILLEAVNSIEVNEEDEWYNVVMGNENSDSSFNENNT
jgi:hypothetical protein